MPTPHLLLAIIVTLAIASPVRADIGVIVLEPVSALGFFTRVGMPARTCPISARTEARSRCECVFQGKAEAS